MKKEGESRISELENEIVRKREESNADVDNYKKKKVAEANKVLFTEEYVKLEVSKHLTNGTKYYFSGENSVIGALLKNVMGRN